ncbi:oligopeptide:H+ symporter [Nonomuraea sp. NBC_00507]|uniref:oligopeptide:H+ symporter n=1 Tax=Nonomuraea sp. NBC_00507 TaxID=2976002 RepID=UPI002E1978C5
MALGLIQYVWGGRSLRGVGERPGLRLSPGERRRFGRLAGLGTGVAVVALGLWAATGTLTIDRLTIVITVIILAVPVAYFAQHHTDLSLFGVRTHQATTQSFNPLFIMIFVPVFAALWVRLGTRVSTPQKFGFALVMVGLSFVAMAIAAGLAGAGRVSVWWLVLVYVIQVFGELSLSPVGLSVTTKLAPEAFKAQMLGVWFIAVSVGDAVGGQTGRLGRVLSDPAYYLVLAALAIVAGVALFMFTRRLRVLMAEHYHAEAIL